MQTSTLSSCDLCPQSPERPAKCATVQVYDPGLGCTLLKCANEQWCLLVSSARYSNRVSGTSFQTGLALVPSFSTSPLSSR